MKNLTTDYAAEVGELTLMDDVPAVEKAVESAKNFIAIGKLSVEEIAVACGLPREKVQTLAAKHLLSQSNIFEKIADICDLPLEKVQASAMK